MRDLNRRQFIDLALNTAKVGGLAVLLGQIPYYELAKKLGVKPQHLPLVFRDWDLQAEAATLPLNYVVTAGTVPVGGDFRNGATELTTNSGSGGTGTSAAIDQTDPSLIKNGGSKNIIINMTAVGGTRTHDTRCTLSPAVTMTQHGSIGIRFYTDTGLNSYLWDWSNNSGDTAAVRFSSFPGISTAVMRGWNYFHVQRDYYNSLVGAGSWLSNMVLTRMQVSTASGSSGSIILDQQSYGGYQHPAMVWMLEGASDSHYTTGFGAWAAKYLQGTLAIPTSLVDSSPGTYLTTGQIDEMYAAGWDVTHMSDTTVALTGLSVQEVVDRLGTADAFLRSKGWTRTLGYCALPGSATTTYRTDANVITALTQLQYNGAIDKWAGYIPFSSIDPDHGFSLNPYRIYALRTDNPDTLTDYRYAVTAGIAAGNPKLFRSGAIGAGAGQITAADHTALLYTLSLYHEAGTARCLPWRKFIKGMNGRMVRA